MNTQEREALILFLQQMGQTPVGPQDPEAQALIQAAMARQPNAGYLLVQRTMQFEFLLQQTQARLVEVQSELDRLKKPVEPNAPRFQFLGDTHAWGRGSVAASPTQSASSVPPVPPAPPASGASVWGSGLLGSVATTAAGIVAGSFLYQGIQNLMGHSGGGAEQAGDGSNNADLNAPAQNSTSNAVHTASIDTGTDAGSISVSSSDMDGGDGGGGD